jgi:alpha-D-ribose 1-methylphosphonate 5-triphosphate synthase subunit PhnH
MTASAVAGLRRTSHESQRDFRVLLDVLSRPGVIGRLAVTAGVPAATIPVAGLADVEVPLAVLAGPGEAEWQRALHLATGAPAADPGRARLVLALRTPDADEIASLPRGDALHPELGARLVIAVEGLFDPGAAAAGDTVLILSGPGIPEVRTLVVRGLPEEIVHAMTRANADFPAGIDTFLVAPDGAVAGLPRTTRMTTAPATGSTLGEH